LEQQDVVLVQSGDQRKVRRQLALPQAQAHQFAGKQKPAAVKGGNNKRLKLANALLAIQNGSDNKEDDSE
jgi:hypothetical protein